MLRLVLILIEVVAWFVIWQIVNVDIFSLSFFVVLSAGSVMIGSAFVAGWLAHEQNS